MDKIPLIRSVLLDRVPNIRCAVSTRNGGVSRESFGLNMSYNVGDDEESVVENRRRFFSSLNVDPHRLATPKQRHTARVSVAHEPGSYESTDGLMTDRPDVWLGISVADCVPVFLVDPEKMAVAAVHAGWRGASGGIVSVAVETMRSEYRSDPAGLVAFIGPSAGVCCYEVGEDVAGRFSQTVIERLETRYHLDLKSENKRQLLACGIPEAQIEISPVCTICNPETMHSYRREKEKSGRMMGVIGIVGN